MSRASRSADLRAHVDDANLLNDEGLPDLERVQERARELAASKRTSPRADSTGDVGQGARSVPGA